MPSVTRALESEIIQAKQQLDTHDPRRTAHRMIYFNLQFDDHLGEYKRTYFAQIDEFLEANPVTGAELVFLQCGDTFPLADQHEIRHRRQSAITYSTCLTSRGLKSRLLGMLRGAGPLILRRRVPTS